MARRFSKCPTWWLRVPSFPGSDFKAGKFAGTSIASLKCVMAISSKIDFSSCKAKLSFSDLEGLTGLSRPMVSKGIAIVEALEIVRVDRSGHGNEYELTVTDDDKYWAKLPTDKMAAQLPLILNRGAVSLAALKIYMQLVALRPNDSDTVALTHEKMRELTGVQKTHIRPALDVLINHSLIRLNQVTSAESKFFHNQYTLLGLQVS